MHKYTNTVFNIVGSTLSPHHSAPILEISAIFGIFFQSVFHAFTNSCGRDCCYNVCFLLPLLIRSLSFTWTLLS